VGFDRILGGAEIVADQAAESSDCHVLGLYVVLDTCPLDNVQLTNFMIS
jgi:hypothetical protein